MSEEQSAHRSSPMPTEPVSPVAGPPTAFSAILMTAQHKAGLGDEQVQKLLGISDRTLGKWLDGSTVPHELTQEAALLRIGQVGEPPQSKLASTKDGVTATAIKPTPAAEPAQPKVEPPVHQTSKVRPTLSMDFIGKQLARHNRQRPSEIPAPIQSRHTVVGQELKLGGAQGGRS